MTGFAREVRGFLRSVGDGLRIFALAPLVPLLAIVPEFGQHVIEVRLGMFASASAFKDHAFDPLRWQFASVKLVGLALAVFFAARFWANRDSGARGWSLAGIAWRPLALGLLVQVLCAVPGMLPLSLGTQVRLATGFVVMLASLPGVVLMIAGLLGDAQMGLREAYVRGWSKALRIALYVGPVWLALQLLHEWNHSIAFGRPAEMVWALMAWDSVLVGAMAMLAGTGCHHGYVGPERR